MALSYHAGRPIADATRRLTRTPRRKRGKVRRCAVNSDELQLQFDRLREDGCLKYWDLQYISAYLNYGSDSGTNLLIPDRGQYYDFGGSWSGQTIGVFGVLRKIGQYYDPEDGFVFHPGREVRLGRHQDMGLRREQKADLNTKAS